ncbi:hypothetical protein [Methylomonas rapida]|uniref:Uncharacterized protein n=1 Tax=Methylomonas rapida TaxID=2963939 RepID=A0ABY7GNF9_9GAMM|nr:hypothetical protein [Methylomonas rapida]WAR46043.1 hypothetical protein NM686_005855 [Methylomonas rapida]
MARGKDLAAIATAYDASGIVDRPSPETLAKLRLANYVVCSDLLRSVESAHARGAICMERIACLANQLFRISAAARLHYPLRPG